MRFRELKLRKNPACPMCGEHRTINKLIDYEEFCGMRGEEAIPVTTAAFRKSPARAEGAA
jgi:sulfur-carrier protein adenylyltransferase/sulfurtransferase